jgi:hypothetical protein
MALDELKTLLALNGNARIPHLESEIFSDPDLYQFYFTKLSHSTALGFDIITKCDIARFVYMYADMMSFRWIEAEQFVSTQSGWATYYAINVIEDRWPEAEAAIFSDPYWCRFYNLNFNNND